MASAITREAAAELAAKLELDLDEAGICQACLSFVSFPLRDGDERETARATAEFAPILWDEGLAEPATLALERAHADGVPHADAGLADVEARREPQRDCQSDRPAACRRPLGALAGRPSTNGVHAMATC